MAEASVSTVEARRRRRWPAAAAGSDSFRDDGAERRRFHSNLIVHVRAANCRSRLAVMNFTAASRRLVKASHNWRATRPQRYIFFLDTFCNKYFFFFGSDYGFSVQLRGEGSPTAGFIIDDRHTADPDNIKHQTHRGRIFQKVVSRSRIGSRLQSQNKYQKFFLGGGALKRKRESVLVGCTKILLSVLNNKTHTAHILPSTRGRHS